MHFLTISGSLRKQSSTNAVLLRMSRVAQPPLVVSMWQDLASIPAFNPDLAEAPPSEVQAFQAAIKASAALLISSPEYAHGVAGALKNALDWLVGSGELYGKPIALINVSSRAILAQAALAETLRTMGAEPLVDISIPATVENCVQGETDGALQALLERMSRAVG